MAYFTWSWFSDDSAATITLILCTASIHECELAACRPAWELLGSAFFGDIAFTRAVRVVSFDGYQQRQLIAQPEKSSEMTTGSDNDWLCTARLGLGVVINQSHSWRFFVLTSSKSSLSGDEQKRSFRVTFQLTFVRYASDLPPKGQSGR
jgi:hypothetical protein